MCGIWGGDCPDSDSCNVFGHDFVDGSCHYCGKEEEGESSTAALEGASGHRPEAG